MAKGGRGFDLVEDIAGVLEVLPVDLLPRLPQRTLRSMRPADIRLGPDRIEWRSTPSQWVPGAPAVDCLINFVALADEEDPRVFLQFAERHGVLGLTENAIPGYVEDRSCPRVPGDPDWGYEPIATWRAYARNAKLILILAMELRQDRPIDPVVVLQSADFELDVEELSGVVGEAVHAAKYLGTMLFNSDENMQVAAATTLIQGWSTAQAEIEELRRQNAEDEEHEAEITPAYDATIDRFNSGGIWLALMRGVPHFQWQRMVLMQMLEDIWLAHSGIQPSIDWTDGPAKLGLKLNSHYLLRGSSRTNWPENPLFSVIAVELAGIVCSDRYVGQCSRCGHLHPTKTKVRTDQPNYCSSCRSIVRRATNRDSGRRRYAREKLKYTEDLTAI